jgi:hypothetical protein
MVNIIQTNNGFLFNGIDSYIYFGDRIASESIQFKIKPHNLEKEHIFGCIKMYDVLYPVNVMIFMDEYNLDMISVIKLRQIF